MHGVAVDSYCK